jgi:outer membrane protein insertion porin family
MLVGAGTVLGQATNPERAAPAGEEVLPELQPYESRLVREVVVRPIEGTREIDAETLGLSRNALRMTEGSAFSVAAAQQDVTSLTRLGRFQRVDAKVQLLADGSVRVAYEVVMQPLIMAVQSVGNRVFKDTDITGEIEYLVGTPIDQTQLDRAARRIEARYQERGYYNAGVSIDADALEDGIVIFRVREGEATKVTDVRFEGNLSFTEDQLKTNILTKDSWLLAPKPLQIDIVDDDVASLGQFYRNQGYLDVRVDRVVTPSPDASEAIVTFVVDEGPGYTLRSTRVIFVDGEPGPNEDIESRIGVFTREQIDGLMIAKPGDMYSEQRLRRSQNAIEAAYGALGYADVRVQRRDMRDGEKPEVDVLFIVRQGQKFRVGEVLIQGNSHTMDKVVRVTLEDIQPDRPANPQAIQQAELRLLRSGRFGQGTETKPGEPARITLQPEDAANPGYRDVLVNVSETNTGSFSIGGAAGSDSGLTAQLRMNQANFDITDTPDSWSEFITGESFKGAGQSFGFTLAPGDRVSTYSVNWSDPNIFDTEYSLGLGARYWSRDYNDYTEKRYGPSLTVGRRLGDRWRVSVPINIESVSLSGIEPDAPRDYFDVEDERLYFSTGIRLSRQTLDDQVLPGRGSIVEVSLDQFFGDATFQRLSAEYARFFTLSEDPLNRKTTLEIKTKIGYIPQDGDDVPFYQRFYQGGRSFRGFKLRTVSPKGIRNDTGELGDDPVGGQFSFFLGAEVKQPLYDDLLAGVVFIDSGTVTEEIALDPYRVSVGVGIRLALPFLSQAPLAFDLGVPVMKADGDKSQFFSFSLDIPFN